MKFEELKVLQVAEAVADEIWRQVIRWDLFPRDVVGKQLARAVDSIGANIAEAFGRFHYGEKLQFLYYARGSLFETKYWINRALARGLIPIAQVEEYATQLTDLARQLNAFARGLKSQRYATEDRYRTVREVPAQYMADVFDESLLPLFRDLDLKWLETIPNT